MQCSAILSAPLAQRACTIASRRPARRTALRAVAFRTDKDSEPTTPPSFTADSAKQLLNSKTAEAGSALSDAATTLLATAQTKWEESDNKPAIVATGFAALFALYITNGIVSTIDRLPVVHTLFELLGVGVTAWFAYKWFFVPGEREVITSDVKAWARDIGINL
ncbi:hypothetical protein ABPG77_006512 [Micractinium sp. CCAP 211/92]